MAIKGMTPRTAIRLEVTVISGESVRLPSGRKLGRGAYAVVHTASSFAVTRVDDEEADCAGYPRWDQAVRVELPPGALGIDVEICRRRSAAGGRGNNSAESVAAARVPVEDFSVGPPGHLHCLSYRLFDTAGARGRNGIVNITVRRLNDHGEGNKAAPDGAKKNELAVPATATAMGKAVDAGACGSGSCSGFGDLGMPAPADGMVIGYPVGIDFTATTTGHANGKGSV